MHHLSSAEVARNSPTAQLFGTIGMAPILYMITCWKLPEEIRFQHRPRRTPQERSLPSHFSALCFLSALLASATREAEKTCALRQGRGLLDLVSGIKKTVKPT